MNVMEILKKYAPTVEKEMRKLIKGRQPWSAYGLIWDLLSRGGKRFRPAMCLLSCEAVGGKKENALPAAVAIELLHNATLLHDDIEDDSKERRGQPCIHIKYGIPLAINAGDVLYFVAYKELLKVKNEEAKKLLAESFILIGEGQAYDINWVREERWDISEKDYLKMVMRKTGVLIGAACASGAFCGGADKKTALALYEYGKAIGMAFQIQDDILNLVGDRKKYGKEIGGDITEGKRTLIVVHALKNANRRDRKRLIEILSSHTRKRREINEAINIMKKYGSIDYASDFARKLVERAKKRLKRAKLKENKATQALFAFADFFITREF